MLATKLILKAAKGLSALEIQLLEPSLPQLFVLSLQAAMKEENLLFFRIYDATWCIKENSTENTEHFEVYTQD